jgi:hypothetical protein
MVFDDFMDFSDFFSYRDKKRTYNEFLVSGNKDLQYDKKYAFKFAALCSPLIHPYDNYVTHTFWSWSLALISK